MAYAGLLSLSHNLEHILHHHLIPQNEQQIETLLERVNSVKDFLENSLPKSGETIESLESKIIDATYKAEYIAESHISYGLVSESSNQGDERFKNLEKVMEEFDSIMQDAMEIRDEIGVQDLQTRMSSLPVASSKPASSGKIHEVVGLDDDMKEIKKLLLTGNQLNLETVSIVGMGGIGKTTLAKKVYEDECIVQHFDIRAWVTVSQDYEVQKILQGLLDSMKIRVEEKKRDEDSRTILHQRIKGRRYLIVLDDVWDTKIWDDLKRSFPNDPDDKNGSRIILTTRLEDVAHYPTSGLHLHHMHFLNEDDSWKLLCKKVFGKDSFPRKLVESGKKIAQNCRGLPLAVVVIGGLLSKDIKTEGFWRNVAENFSSEITSKDEQLLKILSLSYNHLPHHLKGCFLYMGMFPEDFKIRVAVLVKLWVAEGILQPVESRSLEDVAYEYLSDLVHRNLVLASEWSCDGKIKICKVHDLLRDLCMREAQKKNFFHVADENLLGIPRGVDVHRVSIHRDKDILYFHCINLPTSLMPSSLFVGGRLNLQVYANLSLLRVLHKGKGLGYRIILPDETIQLVNLRYLSGRCNQRWPLDLIYKLRNLQTLILYIDASVKLPPEIWNMTELRHVQLFGIVQLSDPPGAVIDGGNSTNVLENLQTLRCIRNFRCTEEVRERIPNLKKLEISYTGNRNWNYYCLDNLGQLHNLETLRCFFYGQSLQPGIFTFPPSLKKLTLLGCKLPWDDMTAVTKLPNLEVLKLKRDAFLGGEWELTEGKFRKLKFLLLERIDLVHWTANDIHFPLLEHLVIKEIYFMEEIPSGIGEIDTMKLIEVHDCSSSLVASAKQIKADRQENTGDDIKVEISY